MVDCSDARGGIGSWAGALSQAKECSPSFPTPPRRMRGRNAVVAPAPPLRCQSFPRPPSPTPYAIVGLLKGPMLTCSLRSLPFRLDFGPLALAATTGKATMLPAALPESLQTIFMMEDSMIVGPYKWPLQVRQEGGSESVVVSPFGCCLEMPRVKSPDKLVRLPTYPRFALIDGWWQAEVRSPLG